MKLRIEVSTSADLRLVQDTLAQAFEERGIRDDFRIAVESLTDQAAVYSQMPALSIMVDETSFTAEIVE